MQAVTNPLSDCPRQLEILLLNQKFKVLYLTGQLKSKQGTESELKFDYFFSKFSTCVWYSISKQVEGDFFNFIVGSMFKKKEC